MAVTSSLKKCQKCGVFSTDSDTCIKCGEILSYQKKQNLKKDKMRKEQVTLLKEELENPNLVERLKSHRYFLFRIIGYLLYSAGVIVSIIGVGLAWIITMVLGG